MHNSPLLQTLRLLTKEELEQLNHFVPSPLFNDSERHKDSTRLFEYLQKRHPDFEADLLDKELTGKTVFPGRTAPKNEVEKTMSALVGVLRKFISFKYFVGGKNRRNQTPTPEQALAYIRQNFALLRFYGERLHAQRQGITAPAPIQGKRPQKAEQFFENLYLDLQRRLAQMPDFEQFSLHDYTDYYHYKARIEQEKALFDSQMERFDNDQNLLAAIESLDEYYLLTKLDLLSMLVHQERLTQPYADDPEQAERFRANYMTMMTALAAMRRENYPISDSVDLYCCLLDFQTAKDPETADALALKFSETLLQRRQLLPAQRFEVFQSTLRSHWTNRYNQSKNELYLQRLHALQREQVDHLERQNRPIISSQLQNMIQVAFKIKATDWAEQLLKRFDNSIIQTPQPELVAEILWALLRFEQKRYAEAVKIFPHYLKYGELEDFNFFAITATADVKLHYQLGDLNDDDYGFPMYRATRLRIERAKNMNAARKERCVNFYKIAWKMFGLQQTWKIQKKRDKLVRELPAIREQLDQLPVVEKEWLEEKYQELVKTESK